eukprot:TRINITY_DN24561_c0_g1_i2.p1 TRINITY_DN24561_c0_g1~~TRINITY_DN24561_c0_g1_i2.p1  ORF type:complete len:227 (-),score=25.44 TRINITY_DN24561_c0_g1_i2:60-740(-)
MLVPQFLMSIRVHTNLDFILSFQLIILKCGYLNIFLEYFWIFVDVPAEIFEQLCIVSSGQTLGVKAQRFRGHTSPHRNVKEFEFETAFGAWYLQSEEHTCLTSETSRTQRTFNPHSSEDRRHSQDYFKQRKLSNASNFLSDFASELGSFNEQEIHIIDACIESKEEDHSSYVAPPVINPHLENILRQLSQQHQCEFRSVDRIAQPMKCNRPSYQEFRALFEEAEQE